MGRGAEIVAVLRASDKIVSLHCLAMALAVSYEAAFSPLDLILEGKGHQHFGGMFSLVFRADS